MHNTSMEQETIGVDFLQKEDLDSIFDRVQMPSLMLTRLKVKKSRQAVQTAFTALNQNMVVIDNNMKDLLFFVQDLAQILFIFVD